MATRFLIVMGVSGSGKTTVGQALAARLGWEFYDGDEFHPAANVAKMAQGLPLDDHDRAPWLAALHGLIAACLAEDRPGVLACSALKARYRRRLAEGLAGVQFIFLQGSYDLIWSRMAARRGHYMKADMLQSQLDGLEEPAGALTIDITRPVEDIVESVIAMIDQPAQIGILGLGVMGHSLALNLHRHGVRVAGYDPQPRLPEIFPVPVMESVEQLVDALERPRLLLLVIPAGKPVDRAIASLRPLLAAGDILVDAGNSHFSDTARRVKSLGAQGIHLIGLGISGGRSGALWGPSLMPGGAAAAWPKVEPFLKAIAATAPDGTPCVAWMGAGGAGHYVKMVHNGIEYADMQLIAEIYDLLHRGAGIGNRALAEVFARWNAGVLNSYLIEITAKILRTIDEAHRVPLVELILDSAAQKGTGKWTSQNALDISASIPTINAAVDSRILSGLKTERVAAARVLGGAEKYRGDPPRLVEAAESALYASKVLTYAQGFAMLRLASRQYEWDFDYAAIATVWQAGSIIRAGLLEAVQAAYVRDPALPNLLFDPGFQQQILARQADWRAVLQTATGLGIPMQAVSSALFYFDAYRSERLPANLVQAQRDYFGAHGFQRIDQEGSFNARWED